jgi:hypothetical protein
MRWARARQAGVGVAARQAIAATVISQFAAERAGGAQLGSGVGAFRCSDRTIRVLGMRHSGTARTRSRREAEKVRWRYAREYSTLQLRSIVRAPRRSDGARVWSGLGGDADSLSRSSVSCTA